MLTRIIRLVGIAFVALMIATVADAQTPAGTCLSAADTTSQKMVRFLDTLVTSSTPERQELVHTLGLSNATIAGIAPITNDSICTQAAIALNAIARVKRSSIPLYVVRVGDRFAVVDTIARINGGNPLWVFDDLWNYVNLLQWF